MQVLSAAKARIMELASQAASPESTSPAPMPSELEPQTVPAFQNDTPSQEDATLVSTRILGGGVVHGLTHFDESNMFGQWGLECIVNPCGIGGFGELALPSVHLEFRIMPLLYRLPLVSSRLNIDFLF